MLKQFPTKVFIERSLEKELLQILKRKRRPSATPNKLFCKKLCPADKEVTNGKHEQQNTKLIKNHHFLDCGRIYKVCITAAAAYPGLLAPG
jgi:hypothetical protein